MTNKIPSEDRRAELYELIREHITTGRSDAQTRNNLNYLDQYWDCIRRAFMTPETIELEFYPGSDVGRCATCMYYTSGMLNKTVTGSINGTVIIMREKKL